jgi:hypothetical protein
MFLDYPVNAARSRNRCGTGGGDGVPFGIFHRNYLAIIKGWSGLELSLTCLQGEFAEDLSEQEVQTKSSGTN